MFETVYVEALAMRVNASVEEDEIWIVPCTRTFTHAHELMQRLVEKGFDADTNIYLWAKTQEEVIHSEQANEAVYERNVTGTDTYYDFIFIVYSDDTRYPALLNTVETTETRHIN
jgi:hypothetical protein